MKNCIILILLTISFLFSQSQIILAPHPTENGTRFSLSVQDLKNSSKPELKKLSEVGITSVSIAGSFNQWRKSEFLMTYDSINLIWSVDNHMV